jgi:hypothetical protein
MKKIVFYLLIFTLIVSCESNEDIDNICFEGEYLNTDMACYASLIKIHNNQNTLQAMYPELTISGSTLAVVDPIPENLKQNGKKFYFNIERKEVRVCNTMGIIQPISLKIINVSELPCNAK